MTVEIETGSDSVEAAAEATEAAAEAVEAAAEAVEAAAEAVDEGGSEAVTEHDLEVVERLVNIERDVSEHSSNAPHMSEDWVRSIAREEASQAVAGLLPAVAEVVEDAEEEVIEEVSDESSDEPEVTIVEPDVQTSEDGGIRKGLFKRIW